MGFGSAPLNPLFRVPAAGGAPVPATKQEIAGGQAHLFPAFLPDGRHFLFYVGTTSGLEKRGIYLGSLDSLESRRLLGDPSNAVYAPAPSSGAGHVLFVRESTLVAQPFDPVRLELAGDLFPVAEQVRGVVRASGNSFSVSAAGAVAVARTAGHTGPTELVWFESGGKARNSKMQYLAR